MGAAGAAGDVLGVEDVFSTYLYTGNGSTQTITNGIDLSGEGGLVWIKSRSLGTSHVLTDTARGSSSQLYSDRTNAQGTVSDQVTAFTGSGFSLGTDSLGTGTVNANTYTYASWTFRKAPKFFDVVTWTGNGVGGATVSHNLGSTPGFIVYKATSATSNWFVYHTSLGLNGSLTLNTADGNPGYGRVSAVSDSSFTTDATGNASGATYVAYLFAHDAGGFGDSGDESVVKCGSFTTDGSYNSSTTLGWEPQWVLIKSSSAVGSWFLFDSMRGMPVSGDDRWLLAETSQAESTSSVACRPNATGFTTYNLSASTTHIYIAIRRGPMKTPTDATEVFNASFGTSSSTGPTFITNFPVDLAIFKTGINSVTPPYTPTRLTNAYLNTTSTAVEATNGSTFTLASNTGWGTSYSSSALSWNFRRAPGFFDVVAYTGTGVARTVPHNLGVEPELMIVKIRNDAYSWAVYTAARGASEYMLLNQTGASSSSLNFWNNTEPTSSVFSVSTGFGVNGNTNTYIAYLFATCPGVSKVGSYTGTGTTLNIDCGFAAGARFVLIKRTDSTGDWYVWDTARGIVSGNDPYLLLNSTAAEVTSTDYIDPLASGFQISSTAPAAINASGGSYIFLAIA